MDLAQGFKEALSCWASGVSVVATRDGRGDRYGVTVSSFCSLSLEPPMVLVCLQNDSTLLQMVGEGGRFAVSILAEGQQDASNWFASRGRVPGPELAIPTEASPSGCPVVRDCAGWLDCERVGAHEEGDHTILLGRVRATFADPSRRPLVYYRRAYRTVTEA